MRQKYLIDTNIISEHIRAKPNVSVISWWDQIDPENLYTTVLNIAEIKKGIFKLDQQDVRRDKLTVWLDQTVIPWFGNNILPINFEIAEQWADCMSKQPNIREIDTLIAATCLVHKCTLVTRNEKDFKSIANLKILNPFEL